MVGMRNVQDTFETRKRTFTNAFSICMTAHLTLPSFNFFAFTEESGTALNNEDRKEF